MRTLSRMMGKTRRDRMQNYTTQAIANVVEASKKALVIRYVMKREELQGTAEIQGLP